MYVCSGPRPRQQIVIKNKMYVTMQIFFSAGINLEYTSRPFFHFDMSFFLYSSPRFQSNFNHICSNQINSLCRFDMSRFLAASTQNNKASNRQIMIFFLQLNPFYLSFGRTEMIVQGNLHLSSYLKDKKWQNIGHD